MTTAPETDDLLYRFVQEKIDSVAERMGLDASFRTIIQISFTPCGQIVE